MGARKLKGRNKIAKIYYGHIFIPEGGEPNNIENFLSQHLFYGRIASNTYPCKYVDRFDFNRDNTCTGTLLQEEVEDTKGVVGIRKPKDRQHNGQKNKDKQRSTKHYTEN